MFFDRKNSQQTNWRMFKKGKFFCYGCALILATGVSLTLPSVEVAAEEVEPSTALVGENQSDSAEAVGENLGTALESASEASDSNNSDFMVRAAAAPGDTTATNQISNGVATIEARESTTGAYRTQSTLNFDIVNPSSQGAPIVIEYNNVYATIADGDLLYQGEVIGQVTSTTTTNVPTTDRMTGAENLAPTDSLQKTVVTITLNGNADKYAADNYLPISIQTQTSGFVAVRALSSNEPYEIPASILINGQEVTATMVPVKPLVINTLVEGDRTEVKSGNTITTVNGVETQNTRSLYIIPGSTGLKDGDLLTVRKGATIPFDNKTVRNDGVTTLVGGEYVLQGGVEELVPVGDKGVYYKKNTDSGVRLVVESVDAKNITFRIKGNLAEDLNPYEWFIVGPQQTLNTVYDGYDGLRTFNDLHVTLTRNGETIYEVIDAVESDRVRVTGPAVVVSTANTHSVYVEYYLDGVLMTGEERGTVLSKVVTGTNYTTRIKDFENYEYVGVLADSAPVEGKSADTDLVVKLNYTAKKEESTETKTISRTIKFEDANGKQLAEPVTQTVTYKRTVTTNKVTGDKTYSAWTTDKADFDAYTSPVIDKYTTTTTSVEAVSTTADSTDAIVAVVYTPTTTETTETKEITRTIKYVDENGNQVAEPVTQTVTYTRTVTTNDVTGEVTYGEWKTDKSDFDAVTSPVVDKHSPTTKVVPKETVTPNSNSSEVVVVYIRDKKISTKPVNPTVPTKPVVPSTPKNPVVSSDSAKPVVSEESIKVNTSSKTVEVTQVSKPSTKTSATSKSQLPKTGDASSSLSLLGLSLVGLTMGAIKMKKKKED